MTMNHPAQTELMSMFHDAVREGFVHVSSIGNDTVDAGCLHAAPAVEGTGFHTIVDGSGRDDSLGLAHTVRADRRAVCTISADDARAIFLAKNDRRSRDRLATRLAQEFSITSKAVRDIWTLRTWIKATKQLWSTEDTNKFLQKVMCAGCRNRGFTSAQQTCPTCCSHRRAKMTATDLVQSSSGRHTTQDQRLAHGIHAAPRESGLVVVAHDQINYRPTTNGLLMAQQSLVAGTLAPSPSRGMEHEPRFEGTWLFDPALVAHDFEELLVEWHTTLRELNHDNAST